ncbi:MAG: thioredoxin family protein [Saprospiraceae bacterium]|nr:thioredoxin family protein [Saprospiraceae bacterium]
MKDIVIFGANCGKCKKAEAIIKSVITKYDLKANITKCENLEVMIQHNVSYLPSIMINNVIKFKGIVPTEKEFLKALQ